MQEINEKQTSHKYTTAYRNDVGIAIEMAESPEISRPLLWTRAQMSINDKKIRCCAMGYLRDNSYGKK